LQDKLISSDLFLVFKTLRQMEDVPLTKERLDRVRWHSMIDMMSYRTKSNFNHERDKAGVQPQGCICEPCSDIPSNWKDIRTKFGYTTLSEMPDPTIEIEKYKSDKIVHNGVRT